jgi:hypothetical protein
VASDKAQKRGKFSETRSEFLDDREKESLLIRLRAVRKRRELYGESGFARHGAPHNPLTRNVNYVNYGYFSLSTYET